MVDSARAGRLSKRILNVVASAVALRLKDERLKYVTFTDCSLTGDLRDATVYYTVRGARITDEPNWELAERALTKHTGRIRSIVGRELGIRFTPTLTFVRDTIPETSASIERALAEAKAQDERTHKLAEGKEFAGDPNPYGDPDAHEGDVVDEQD